MPEPFAFISYRRSDYSAAARCLKNDLEQAFGADRVFMDVQAIKPGEPWPLRLETALAKASVTLAVIGPTWLRVADRYGRRRLDNRADWVRREIEYSLPKGIIPVLVGGATIPPAEALPKSIAELSNKQALELREDKWQRDVLELLEAMEGLGFDTIKTSHLYPVMPCNLEKNMLDERALATAIASLPGWRRIKTRNSDAKSGVAEELHRTFEFTTFEEAMQFMQDCTFKVADLNHHPRWENSWRTVSVWLTTWDLDCKISNLDLDLAGVFDSIYVDIRRKTE